MEGGGGDVRRGDKGARGAAGGHGIGAPPGRRRGGRQSLPLPAAVAVVRGIVVPRTHRLGLLCRKGSLLLLVRLLLLRGRGGGRKGRPLLAGGEVLFADGLPGIILDFFPGIGLQFGNVAFVGVFGLRA